MKVEIKTNITNNRYRPDELCKEDGVYVTAGHTFGLYDSHEYKFVSFQGKVVQVSTRGSICKFGPATWAGPFVKIPHDSVTVTFSNE